MDSRGRIGVIIPHVSSNIDTQFIDAIHTTAAEHGYDTVVITGVINYLDEHLEKLYSKGQVNIYDLILHGSFDGFVFEADFFCSEKLRRTVHSLLNRSGTPCVTVNYEHPDFPTVSADETSLLYISAMHLIREHGCKRLYCIGGFRGHAPSEARISGFRRAMSEAGLACDESDIFYGNYWKDVPRAVAADIASGTLTKPDGIVCGSDIMAVELCRALNKHGLRVPEDIAVTGCDGSVISQTEGISLTTVAGQARKNGILAVTELLGLMGVNVGDSDMQPGLVIGESCGCGECGGIRRSSSRSDIREYAGAVFDLLEHRKTNSHGEIIRRMSECGDIYDVLGTFMGCSYMIPTGIRAELCLCEDWCRDLDDPSVFRRGGLSDNMLLGIAVSGNINVDGTCICEDKMVEFPSAEVFPSLNKPHEPRLIVVSSLHYKGQIFGYVGITYEKAVRIVLDDFYMSWCDAISSGLNTVQNHMYKDYVNKRIESLSEFAPVLGVYNKRGLINKLIGIMAENSNSAVTLAMLSYIKEDRVHYGVPPINSIVNAIRIGNSKAVLASISDDIIAVVLTDGKQLADEQELAQYIADSVTSSYRGTVEIKQERIAAVCGSVAQTDIFIIDSFIGEMEEKLRGRIISQSSGSFSYKERFIALRNDIMKHPEKDWNLEAVNRRMGLSKSHFHRLYKEFFDTSCKEDIITSRLEKVKWLLGNTSLSVAQISEQCGYANISHLIRQFSSRTGMTPSAYRKETGQNE